MRPAAAFPALAAALLLAACSTATQRTYVAPTSQTVVSTTEVRREDPPEHLIFVENHSTVPVTVFSYSLTGCENVKQQCNVRPVSIRIAPGGRHMVTRIEPDNRMRGFGYHFGFSWRADSSSAGALAALAASGDTSAQARLAAMRRADSIARTEAGGGYRELTRSEFIALAGRATRLVARPDSLVIEPGQRTTLERVQLFVADSQGVPFGRTRWVRWRVPTSNALQFIPPDELITRAPGRIVVRFRLAEEAETILQRPIPEIEVPVVVAYPPDPHAPLFTGLARDADSRTPLPCLRVALEDSAQNVVATSRTVKDGTFMLNAPRPGTYRVRFELFGWAPVYGPLDLARPDEMKQHEYPVRFAEQMLMARRGPPVGDFEHAYPAAVSTPPIGAARAGGTTPVIPAVTLGGSESMPILGIVGGAPAGTTWMTFVVDSTGRVDPASVLLPPDASKAAVTSVRSVFPRVRFSPAREAGKPTCELLKMQVNFSPR